MSWFHRSFKVLTNGATILRRNTKSAVKTQRQFYNNNNNQGIKSNKACKLLIGTLAFAFPPFIVYKYVNCEGMEDDHKAASEGLTLNKAIEISRDLVQRIKDETGSPGLVVSVSIDGKEVWSEGLGFADIENRVPCTPDTVFRIASISKSIAMALVAKQWEAGKLDLDKPIQHYVPEFPEKSLDGEKVTITTRQLVSHLGGIRHYDKDYMKDKLNEGSKSEKQSSTSGGGAQPDQDSKEKKTSSTENKPEKNEMALKEYYITKHYSSVKDSLSLFLNDPLVHKPGTKFLYTTHGWTLISAVVEAASKEKFEVLLRRMLKDMGMHNTFLDENSPLIYHRGRHYVKNKTGRLLNAPYVDCSYKWAGGGLLSNVHDLTRFGNIMLYSYQYRKHHTMSGSQKSRKGNEMPIIQDAQNTKDKLSIEPAEKPGYLKSETMEIVWKPVDKTVCSWDKDASYAMGWAVCPEKYENGECRHQRFYVSHTGGAIGGSSVLLILPPKSQDEGNKDTYKPPKGVVVAIVVNMISVGLNKTALEIGQVFEKVEK
ncbi:hypothetical protein FSP39_015601 [Pinctada imbricata]|uniref:Beta-lactamase-related domain-containing protein n=1 Tax=Pinctada imbricata TaxID=66713 RepID=A0AA89C5I1_PINIB|nr:hypothetical protein FSP39_015601 [Pinctada imbricata]